MLNISKHGEIDLSAIDMRTITPEEWEALKWGALKRVVTRRAHAERAKAMRELLTPLRSWWQTPRGRGETLPT
jgi:hypothetical protein